MLLFHFSSFMVWKAMLVKFYDLFFIDVFVFFLLNMLFMNGFCKTKIKGGFFWDAFGKG